MAIDTIKSTAVLDGAIATADIADDAVTADKLANAINTSIAVGVAALPKAGGTMTGTIADFRSTGIDDNSNALAMTIDVNENIGLGSVPATDWHANYSVLQLGGQSGFWTHKAVGTGKALHISHNTEYDTGFKYIAADEASLYMQGDGGKHIFSTAAAGTAGNAITFKTVMTMKNNTNISIPSNTHAVVGVEEALNINCFRDSSGNDFGIFLNGNNSAGTHTSIRFHNNVHGVCGSITNGTTSTAYNTSSDYRLKENVVPMSGATAQTKLLKPCNFDWIVGGNTNGFLAHELAEVVPEAVTGTKDAMMDEEYEVTPAVLDDEGNETTAAVMGTRSVPDMQGIDQSKLVPLLVKTIQELEARITALEDA